MAEKMASKKTPVQLELLISDEKALQRLRSFGSRMDALTAPLARGMALEKGFNAQLSAPIKRLTWLSKNLGAATKKLNYAVALPLVGAGTLALGVTAQFDRVISRVQALTGGSLDQMERLKKKAFEVAGATKFSSTDMAMALEKLSVSGYTPVQS